MLTLAESIEKLYEVIPKNNGYIDTDLLVKYSEFADFVYESIKQNPDRMLATILVNAIANGFIDSINN